MLAKSRLRRLLTPFWERLKDIKDGVTLTGSTVVEGTLQNAAAANGNGTNLSISRLPTTIFTVSGTFVATVNLETSTDSGTTWYPLMATRIGDGIVGTTATAAGLYRATTTGLGMVRARISGYSSGSVTVKAEATALNSASKNIQVAGSRVEEVTFHNAATVAAQGTALTVGGHKTLTVEITGTSTSRTIAFQGAGPSGTYRAIAGVRLADLAVATTTSVSDAIWQFDVTGLVTVIMNLTEVSGGNVTVRGRAVA